MIPAGNNIRAWVDGYGGWISVRRRLAFVDHSSFRLPFSSCSLSLSLSFSFSKNWGACGIGESVGLASFTNKIRDFAFV